MKKLLFLYAAILLSHSCSSLQDPGLCGIDISQLGSWTDFSFMEGDNPSAILNFALNLINAVRPAR